MTETSLSTKRLWFFGLLYLLSGVSGLIYQVVWARTLQLSFGITSIAVSAVLAAFFLGLALVFVSGWKVQRSSHTAAAGLWRRGNHDWPGVNLSDTVPAST